MAEFKVGDTIVEIGGHIIYKVVGIASDWYDVSTDYPIPCQPWVTKKDARLNYIKLNGEDD